MERDTIITLPSGMETTVECGCASGTATLVAEARS